jgi:hypothetical protein
MAKAYLYDLTDTWNAGATTFTAIKMNVTDTASNAASLLMDLQVGGSSRVSVTKGGVLTTLGRSKINTLTVGLGGQTSVSTNTAIGFEALNSASLTGAENTGIGYQTLLSNTTGARNTTLGLSSLKDNTTGSDNSVTGRDSMLLNTTGNNNSAIGRSTLRENTTGSNSTAIGFEALRRFTGNTNTALGYQALLGGDATPANNTGVNNIGIGFKAGDAITSGSGNIVIGYDIDVDSATGSNQINIGGVYFHDRLVYTERTDPAAPGSNQAVIYTRDNGSGKTQLCVRFNTGAVQVLATEP